MSSVGSSNDGPEDITYEAIAARYLAQHNRAKENDRAASAFNMWENEVRNDLYYYNEWN